MINETDHPNSFLPLLAGLVPFYVLVTTTAAGLVVAGAFLLAYTVAFVSVLYLPSTLGKKINFISAILFASIAVSMFASLIRIIDPFLYERFFSALFMTCFSAPIFYIAGLFGPHIDRDRGWEQLAHGLGLSLSILLIGLLRELIATGSIQIGTVQSAQSRTILAFMAQPSGAFFLLALILASGRIASRIIKRSTV